MQPFLTKGFPSSIRHPWWPWESKSIQLQIHNDARVGKFRNDFVTLHRMWKSKISVYSFTKYFN